MSNNKSVSSSITRVSIPNNLRKTITNIKEIAENHSEDDIYAMLLDCSMDPNETAQRLLHLDTFHQVKSKRDKRNEVVKIRPDEASRWKAGHYGRGTRGARGNAFSQYSSRDVGGRMSNFTRKENGVKDNKDKGFKYPPAPVLYEANTIQPRPVEKPFPISINGPTKIPNGNLGGGRDFTPYRIDTESSDLIDIGLSKTESISNNHSHLPDLPHVDDSLSSSSMFEKDVSKVRELPASEKIHAPNSISVVQPLSPMDVGSRAGVEEATSKLAKLKFVDCQNVIIPDHIQVPDAVKNVLSFGSINANFDVRVNSATSDNINNLHSTKNATPDEATENSLLCDKIAVSSAIPIEHEDNQQLQSHLPDENHPMDIRVSSSAAVAPQFPIVQTTPSYSFGVMPPVLASAPSQTEGVKSEAHVSSSRTEGSGAVSTSSLTPPVTQSTGVVGLPQQFPIFHQYPPNFFPYGHYFSPIYAPPMHQYYGPTSFLPPFPNMLIPPPTAQVAMETSAQYKPGANAGNQAANGLPSGYSLNAAVTSGNQSTSADLMPTALKDNYIFSGQQAEGSAVWHPTVSQDNANFPLNSFINYPPQGHHLITPHSSHGPFAFYHTMQPMPSPPPGLPLLHQSQPLTGQLESAGPPANLYQQLQSQPQSPINWNL